MSAVAHCAVVRNPFSTAVTHAKLPDGAVSMSSSCRYSNSLEISDNIGYIDILLFPGFHTPMVFRANISTTSSPSFQNQVVTYKVPSRTYTTASTATSTGGDLVLVSSNSVPNQYRIVSQGLRLSLINNSMDNDGWFEAVRVSPSYSPGDFSVNYNGTQLFIAPNMSQFENKLCGTVQGGSSFDGADLSMNPSYIAGKLRDIHKHVFYLQRQENNDFIELPRTTTHKLGQWNSQNYVYGSSTTDYRPGAIADSTTGGDYYVDKRMDAVLIRLRANPTGGSAGGTVRLHAHVVQHVEETYDEQSDIYRFQTTCPVNKRLLDATLAAMKRDIKPSIIRSPTLPVSTTYSQYKRKRSTRKKW